jgi:hypothetical protein
MTLRRPQGLTPHIFVRGADAALAFYRQAFSAEELFRQTLPDGRVLFIEVAVGPGRLLISEETPSLNALAPPSIGGSPVLLLLESDEVDQLAERAVGSWRRGGAAHPGDVLGRALRRVARPVRPSLGALDRARRAHPRRDCQACTPAV